MYIIHDIKYDTYYTSGTQTSRDGRPGPRWTGDRHEATRFRSISEVKAVMYRLKNIKNQDNHSIMYEVY